MKRIYSICPMTIKCRKERSEMIVERYGKATVIFIWSVQWEEKAIWWGFFSIIICPFPEVHQPINTIIKLCCSKNSFFFILFIVEVISNDRLYQSSHLVLFLVKMSLKRYLFPAVTSCQWYDDSDDHPHFTDPVEQADRPIDRCLMLFYSLKWRVSIFISLFFTKVKNEREDERRECQSSKQSCMNRDRKREGERKRTRRMNFIWTGEMMSSSRTKSDQDIYLYAYKLIKDNKGVHWSTNLISSIECISYFLFASSSSMTQSRWMPSVSHLQLRCECPSVTRNSFKVWCYFEFKWPFHSLFLINANASSHTTYTLQFVEGQSIGNRSV